MSSYARPIDISNIPELVRLVEEVETTKKPRELQRDDTIVAILTPVEKHQPNQQAIEETLALAGSWRALDYDDMLAELDRIRHESKPTPPFALDL